MKKRVLTIIISYTAALVAVLLGFCIQFYVKSTGYERSISSSYAKCFGDVSDLLNSLSYALQKTEYVTGDSHMVTLAAEIWNGASAARAKLDDLPSDDQSVKAASKFLSQTGEFVYSLAKTTLNGEKISEENKKTLSSLSEKATELSEEMSRLRGELLEKNAEYHDIMTLFASGSADGGSGIMSTDLSSTPTLIYDGPYSENLYKKESAFLNAHDDVTEKDALKTAEKLVGDGLTVKGVSDGTIKSYYIGNDSADVLVTVKGGFVKSVYSHRAVGDVVLSDNDAVKKGLDYLKKIGYNDMLPTYYNISANVLTASYVFVAENGALCYPDQVKVGIALDNGDILSLDATTYLQNHGSDRTAAALITAEDAQAEISPSLSLVSSSLAYIPTDGGNEKLCYEFKTKNSGGETVIIYINAVSGAEEDILIAIETESGTLTE